MERQKDGKEGEEGKMGRKVRRKDGKEGEEEGRKVKWGMKCVYTHTHTPHTKHL